MITKILHQFSRKRSFQELISNSIISMAFKTGGMLSGYIFIFIALRFGGIADLGAFSLSVAIIQIGAILGRMGFDISIVKHVAQLVTAGQSGEIQTIYLKGLRIISLSGGLCTLLLYVAAPSLASHLFHDARLTSSFQWSAVALLPTVYTFYNAGALRGLKKAALYTMLTNTGYFAASVFLLLGLITPIFPDNLIVYYSIGSVFLAIISFVMWSSHRPAANINKASMNYKELITISFPMLAASAINLVNGWTDTLLLGILSDSSAVGTFHVLLKAAAILNIVLFAVNSISAPQFAKLNHLGNQQQLQLYVTKSTQLIVILSIPVLLILALGYIPLIHLLTNDFDPHHFATAFALLCFGQAINSFCGSGGQLLTMTGHQHINRNIVIVSFLISVVTNVVFIPLYGVTGAALANMICLVTRNILYVFFCQRLLNMNTLYNPLTPIFHMLKKKSI